MSQCNHLWDLLCPPACWKLILQLIFIAAGYGQRFLWTYYEYAVDVLVFHLTVVIHGLFFVANALSRDQLNSYLNYPTYSLEHWILLDNRLFSISRDEKRFIFCNWICRGLIKQRMYSWIDAICKYMIDDCSSRWRNIRSMGLVWSFHWERCFYYWLMSLRRSLIVDY